MHAILYFTGGGNQIYLYSVYIYECFIQLNHAIVIVCRVVLHFGGLQLENILYTNLLWTKVLFGHILVSAQYDPFPIVKLTFSPYIVFRE